MSQAKPKNFLVEVCPNLLRMWNNNNLMFKDVYITKTDVNLVTNKLTIFCNKKNHNCFCDKRVRKNPTSILVVRGKEIN